MAQLGICSGEVLSFQRGQPLEAHQFTLRICALRQPDLSLDGAVRAEVVASVNESAAALYEAVRDACGLPGASFRLRKVLGGGAGVGSVVRQRDMIADALPGISDGLTLALQVAIEGPSELDDGDVSVFIRKLGIDGGADAVCRIGDAVEVVLRESMRHKAEDLAEAVARLAGIEVGCLPSFRGSAALHLSMHFAAR